MLKVMWDEGTHAIQNDGEETEKDTISRTDVLANGRYRHQALLAVYQKRNKRMMDFQFPANSDVRLTKFRHQESSRRK